MEITAFVMDTPHCGRLVTSITAENRALAVEGFACIPKNSRCHASVELGMKERSVFWLLKAGKFRPYILRLVHDLIEDDRDCRLQL